MSEENKKELKTVKVVKVKAKTVTAKPVAKQSTEPKQIKQTAIQKPVEQKTAIQARSEQKRPSQPKQAVATRPVSQPKQASSQTRAPKPAQKQAPRQQAVVEKPYNTSIHNKWWFWLAMALIILGIVAVFKYGVPYANHDTSNDSAQVTAAEGEDKNNALSMDEGLLTVELTVPASFFQNETKEEIEASAKERGILECRVNDDGSVTYKMTRSKRKEILKSFKEEIDTSIQELTSGGEDAPKSFKTITYNSSVTQFDVRVDRAVYESNMFDSMYALGLYFLGGYYQIFDGVPNDKLDVIVNFIDDSTGEIIESGSLQKMMENSNS